MALVTETALPDYSKLHTVMQPGDFLDCYVVASDMPPRAAADIITSFPAWAMLLVRLRGILTTPFGLRQDSPKDEDTVGIFPVEYDSDQELIAGFDDKHLNFRVSVCAFDGKVHLATWVHRNNLFGRLYLATIMPFHILIARDALKRVAKAGSRPSISCPTIS